MTKKELIEELKDLPDDCIVLLDEWSEGIYEWKNIEYVYSYNPSIVRLHPTIEAYCPESWKEEKDVIPYGPSGSST